MVDYIGETICFFADFLCPRYLSMIQSEWNHTKVSFTEQKVDYNIIYHKQERSGCFIMTLCSAYQVTHTWCDQNEPWKR